MKRSTKRILIDNLIMLSLMFPFAVSRDYWTVAAIIISGLWNYYDGITRHELD